MFLGERNMEFALELMSNLIYVMCFIGIGQLFLDFKRRNYKYEKAIMFILILLITIVYMYAELWLKMAAHALCVLIILYVYFVEKKKALVGLYFGGIAIMALFPLMFKLVILQIVSYLKISVMATGVTVLSSIIVCFVILVVGKYFKRKYPSGLRGIGIRYLFFFATILLVDAFVVGFLGDFIVNDVQASRKWILSVAYIGAVLGILVQIILLINALITRNVYKENEALAKQYLDSQQAHYAYLEKREYETKRFRHDIKNHLFVLENCMETQDYAKAYKYLDTLNEKVNAFSNHVSVNNNIADAILNKFYSDAQEEGIELQVKGHFPLECHIAPFDICTILSNLLSNAILAENQCGGKRVLVDIRYTKDEVLIFVENDYGHELQGKNGTLETTKVDSFNHGFGLSNVKECVEKAGGYISISTKDNRFKVMLSMRNE